jgi:class 3 adenylate cyclase
LVTVLATDYPTIKDDPMATEDFKRKLTAIFTADVEGYSRLMREDE